MLFNSIHFALFLPVVFALYWRLVHRQLRAQNFLLLVASYFFYACWDYRFLFLLIFSTALDFFSGLQMERAKTPGRRKAWFWISVCINLGFLGVFKYYDFFAESLVSSLAHLGIQAHLSTLNIILPVGISFYTFHGLSYVIDIYKKRISPVHDFTDYAVFVSFFPLLVAGPIERATHLLPQLQRPRRFDYEQAADGLRQILWGLFKKIVVADNCAAFVNDVFAGQSGYHAGTLLLGAVFFAFQIYGDFSGYSDIALGTARLFGIDLLRNFAYPYFSRNIAEFWRRWHISLSSWFRDYVYIPLGGSKVSIARQVRNTFVIFLLSGFWHGANWTFIAWGLLNALYFLPLLLAKKNRSFLEVAGQNSPLPSFREFLQIGITFSLVCLAWVFFRAESVSAAMAYLRHLFTWETGNQLAVQPVIVISILVLLAVEWLQRKEKHGFQFREKISWQPLRWLIYLVTALAVGMYFGNSTAFIYFQF